MDKRELKRIEKEKAFIEKAMRIPCNANVDYSMVKYINNRIPVHLYDKDKRSDGTDYGDFWQTPYNHLRGQQHPDKRGARIAKSKSLATEEVVERFREKHKGENLDYSKVVYRNMHTKVCIIDHDKKPDGTEWGEYWQEPVVHLKGCGHPQKAIYKNADLCRDTTESWVAKAKKAQPDEKYDFSLVDYKTSQIPVTIICRRTNKRGKVHGPFSAMPDAFLQGKGCPKCGKHLSYAEEDILNFVRGLGFNAIHNDHNTLGGKEIDIFIPDLKIGIEYNGLRWHSEVFERADKRHVEKTEMCEGNGIRLIQIFEDEWLHKKNIVLSAIRHILGCNKGNKIMGRQCAVRDIDKTTAKLFLDNNHIQGFVASTVYLGAYCDEALAGVMTFRKEGKDSLNWELTRFATDISKQCVGLGGKLFKSFLRNYEYGEIKSFADRRWTSLRGENLYTKLGFVLDSVLKPDYRYVDFSTNTRRHKFGFRKQTLHKKYGLPLTMTEKEMTEELGFYRIWDCGLLKYVYHH